MSQYKQITRRYYDARDNQWRTGKFIGGGEFADGHVAYDLLDDDGNPIESEQAMWYQMRSFGRLIMVRY